MLKYTNTIIEIRGHHLLCMQHFKGLGYNQNFIDNMKKIINEIEQNKNLGLKIIAKCDIICEYCPHNNCGICKKDYTSETEIVMKDLAFLKYFKLNENEIINAQKIFYFIKNELKTDINILNLCGKCEWKKTCISMHGNYI